jgi:phosphate starvation-inducible PhoH-like protein
MPTYKTGTNGIPLLQKLKFKNESQKIATDLINQNILTFVGGPAGSAKTFLAVAQMVDALKNGSVQKAIISRPTVEAGETMGYLPGDINEKLDPYVKPIYDNLEYFVGPEYAKKMVEDGLIEIVPFQFMRGRTFNDAFIILDEVQNATTTQLKLALTRIGFGSKCVVTYDKAQLDIPFSDSCVRVIDVFKERDNIGFFEFKKTDICRSPIVSQVLDILDGI